MYERFVGQVNEAYRRVLPAMNRELWFLTVDEYGESEPVDVTNIVQIIHTK